MSKEEEYAKDIGRDERIVCVYCGAQFGSLAEKRDHKCHKDDHDDAPSLTSGKWRFPVSGDVGA